MYIPQLNAELQHIVLTDGGYRRHVERLRARLAQARQRTIARLKTIGIAPWIEPRSGFFLWCPLGDGIDAADVARHGLAENIVFAPGNVFSLSGAHASYMRFNAAMMDDPRIFDFLARIIR